MATKASPRKHACPTCSLEFSKPAYVRQHMLVHGDQAHLSRLQSSLPADARPSVEVQRAHVCPHAGCGQAYKRVDHLNRHLLHHDGVLFQCERGCGTTFTTKEALHKHRVRQQDCVARKLPDPSSAQAQAAVAPAKASSRAACGTAAPGEGVKVVGKGRAVEGIEDRRGAGEGEAERRSDVGAAPAEETRARKRSAVVQGSRGDVRGGGDEGRVRGGGARAYKKPCVPPSCGGDSSTRDPSVSLATSQNLHASSVSAFTAFSRVSASSPSSSPSPPFSAPSSSAAAKAERDSRGGAGLNATFDQASVSGKGHVHLQEQQEDPSLHGQASPPTPKLAQAFSLMRDPARASPRTKGNGQACSEDEGSEGGEEGEGKEEVGTAGDSDDSEEDEEGDWEEGESEVGEVAGGEGEEGEGEDWEENGSSGSESDGDSPPIGPPAPTHFVCGACIKLFPSQAHLDAHMKEAHESSQCPLCSKTLKSANLVRHIKDRHGTAPKPKRFPCPLKPCDKIYTSKFNLAHHMHFGHFRHRLYPCSFEGCGKAFSTKQLMQRHVKAAHEYQEETYPEKQEQMFLEKKRSWTGRRPYAADQFVKTVFAALPEEEKAP